MKTNEKIFLSVFTLILVFGFVGIAKAGVSSPTPSTNDINRTNGWAHVNQLSQGVGTTDLQFISTRSFASCFEYRTDGDTSQSTGANFNTLITDGLYPFYCQNNSSRTETITANEYVEVRMVFGAESDERFDWTRFDVLPETKISFLLSGAEAKCSGNFEVKVTIKKDDVAVEGEEITFKYKNEEKKATSNDKGEAAVTYNWGGEYEVTAYSPTYGTLTKTASHDDDCPAGEEPKGEVLGVSEEPKGEVLGITTQTAGSVLGTSTMANTGTTDDLIGLVFTAGALMTTLGLRPYKTKKS